MNPLRRQLAGLALYTCSSVAQADMAVVPDPAAGTTEQSAWVLIWQDEFNGPEINRDNWTHETGGHGWGNNESQFYTDDPANSHIADGHLVIRALKGKSQRRRFTSARLNTSNKVEVQYGRIEARMKLPRGQGLWPAFWMLGAGFPKDGWPHCGEIDIMENIGSKPGVVHGSVHGPGYAGPDGIGRQFQGDAESNFADNFHRFAVEWQENSIRWLVDDALYFQLNPQDLPGDWVFNRPYFLLLNLAVGGKWPGSPARNTAFPQSLTVDYVRIYKKTGDDLTLP